MGKWGVFTMRSVGMLVLLMAGSASFSIKAQAAVCTFGTSTSEPSLQTIVDQRISPTFSTTTSCLADGADSYWSASQGAAATILVEVAGYANQNTFGIYDRNDPTRRLQLFSGSAGSNASRTITVSATDGGYEFVVAQPNGTVQGSNIFGSQSFGYYLTTPQFPGRDFFSDTTLNSDGVDHLYGYQGNNGMFLNNNYVPPSLRGLTFDAGMYLLAWEDLYGGGDRDYQDMVVVTQNISAVPLPGALLLFGSGLVGLGFLRRRKC